MPRAPRPQDFQLGFGIVQLCRTHRAAAGALLATLGLHPGQEVILMQLWHEDGQSQKKLAQRMGVQPPTVTKMLQRLEASGIVERRESTTDGRSMNAFLTQKGRDLEPQVQATWAELERRTSAQLSPTELEMFGVTLEKILANLRDTATDEDEC
ncbi:MAG: MarR family transcriptional regulator [Pleurocapsa sp. SU_196_0]|nr:MarR family transcriptional regulator [Pleurocapsa sp. SU_196_0]